jgi:lathosterol oxidase
MLTYKAQQTFLSTPNNMPDNAKWHCGIGGLGPNFALFNTSPSWVDTSLPPGHTPQVLSEIEWGFMLTGKYLIYSINLVWLFIAILVYIVFPYDYEVSKQWDLNYGLWIARRALLNVTIVHIYYGFWHGTLYGLGWSHRPFNKDRGAYRWSKLMHNMWYTTLGALQWTGWEAMMIHCYATGRMAYLSDEEAFASPVYGIAHFLGWTIAVPLYRDVHFYFAHRLLHIRALYTYVHAVHHRNTDIEPFSGLCMHPIEHMYYFTSIALSLYVCATPFAFLWNGIHLIISPGASHSGFEDHANSAQHHYLHHRYFECNYGTPSFLLDNIFGTFRDKLSTKSDTYHGDANGVGSKTAAALDCKATLACLPEWDQLVFNLSFCVVIPVVFVLALVDPTSFSLLDPTMLALAVVVGPVVGGISLLLLKSWIIQATRGKTFSKESIRRKLVYPFHKEAIPRFGMHILVGTVMGILPAYHLFHMTLAEKGHGAYFTLKSLTQQR